jgi:hypothetical protein
LIGIINRAEKVIYDPVRAQVKVARVSEAASQGVSDVLRRVGEERQRALSTAWYDFRPAGSSAREVFVIRHHPQVSPTLYLLNASGSRMPAPAINELRALRIQTTELWYDFTVDQLTNLTISLVDSAIAILKAN